MTGFRFPSTDHYRAKANDKHEFRYRHNTEQGTGASGADD